MLASGCFSPAGSGATSPSEPGTSDDGTGTATGTTDPSPTTTTSTTDVPTTLPSQTETGGTTDPVTGTTAVTPSTATTDIPANCGDDLDDPGEECDDGNNDDGDGCLSNCKLNVCGDGFINPGVEQCDDGPANADDGNCKLDCKLWACNDGHICHECGEECDGVLDCHPDSCTFTGRYVFVTEGTWMGAAIGGPELADTRCMDAVDGKDKFAGRTFRAWLSTASEDAIDRIGHSPVPYVRVDGMLIAANSDDFLDPLTMHVVPINVTETNSVVDPTIGVWTGTYNDGTKSAETTLCGGWIDPVAEGRYGNTDAVDYHWTDQDLAQCDTVGRLYCFQIGADR